MPTPLRVLIAEDEYTSATLLEFLVTEEGHEVCGIVSRGAEVMSAVQDLQPDVVLMDVHLADDMSGISATRALVRQVNVPVIVVSATENQDEMEEIAASGALGFMKKPISADELKVNLRIAKHHNEVMRKLRDSELLHRSLFDNAAVGIYICHKDGYYLASNQSFARMLGYSGPAELLRLVKSLDEQVYARPGRRAELLAELAAGRELRDVESEVYGKDGDLLWVSEHLAPNMNEDGSFNHYEGVVINITDRKRAEAEKALAYALVQNTMDAIADYVAVTDLRGNIIMANKAFEERLAPIVGAARMLHPWPCEDGENLFERFLTGLEEQPTGQAEVRGGFCIAGLEALFDTTISRYCTPRGEVAGAVFVMRPTEYIA